MSHRTLAIAEDDDGDMVSHCTSGALKSTHRMTELCSETHDRDCCSWERGFGLRRGAVVHTKQDGRFWNG